MIDPFWCKHCRTEFLINFDDSLTGDALIRCPTCGWRHPRQFENGVAVSCNPPRGSYTAIWVVGHEDGREVPNMGATDQPTRTTTTNIEPSAASAKPGESS